MNHAANMIVPTTNSSSILTSLTSASDLLIALPVMLFLILNWFWREKKTADPYNSAYPDKHHDDPLLDVKTLAKGHELDIAMLTASPDGVVVSVGLDRHIKIWDLRQETRTHFIDIDPRRPSPFPVLATAIDDQAEWIALLCSSGLIMLWNINDRKWGPSDKVEIKSRTPLSFFFRPSKLDKAEGAIAPLVLIRTSGLLTEIDFVINGDNNMIHLQLCKSPLVCTVQFIDKFTIPGETSLRIVTASRRGCVHLASQLPDRWLSDDVPLYAPDEDKEVKSVLPLPGIGLFLAIRTNAVDLVHVSTHGILHTFQNLNMKPNTLQCFHSVKRKPHCGLDGLASFSLAYTDRDTGHLVLMTYIPKQEGDLICIGPKKCSTDISCNSWTEARLSKYKVRNPGQWQSLPSGAVVGVRKRSAHQHTSHNPISVVSSLRKRTTTVSAPKSACASKSKNQDADVWEAWMISAKGEEHTVPLYSDKEIGGHQLWVTACGPMTRVGRRSVALGFGNVIKVITVGHEWWDGAEDVAEDFSNKLGRERRRKGKHGHHADKQGTSTPKMGGNGGCCTLEAFGTGSGMPTPVKEKLGFDFGAGMAGIGGSGVATPTPHTMGRQPPLPMKVETLTLPMKGRRQSTQMNGSILPVAVPVIPVAATHTSTSVASVTSGGGGGSCCGTRAQSPVQSPVNDGFVMVNPPASGFPNGMTGGNSGKRSCAA